MSLSHLLSRLAASVGRPIDVLGVGECSQDLVLRLPAGVALDRPLPEKLCAAELVVLGGGQIATALVAARRLGRSAAFCGAVGDDAIGREVLAELGREGVLTPCVRVCAGATTRSAVLLVDAAGERVVLEVRHPALGPGEAAPDEHLVATARTLHVDGTFPAASLAAARLARRHGTLVSVDLDRPFPGVEELLELADVCAVSASFPEQLFGETGEQAALRLRERAAQAQVVLVTRGERGCLLVGEAPGPSERASTAVPAGPRLRAVPAFVPPLLRDTTACGDTFHAALLVALLRRADAPAAPALPPLLQHEHDEETLLQLVRFAQAAAALKCRDLGRRGCPWLDEVTAFLRAAPEPAGEARAAREPGPAG
ncbi:MAG: carbohydrate kinase family protein [Polyangia bacterium]